MAKMSYKMPDDFLTKISRLGNRTDEIVPVVLEAGASVVESRVRSNLQSVIGTNLKSNPRSTGQLLGALGTSPAKLNSDGNFDIKVGFAENRTDGVSNAMLAGVLEYGKHNQPAKPFLKPAQRQSEKDCIEAMQRAFESEVSKI